MSDGVCAVRCLFSGSAHCGPNRSRLGELTPAVRSGRRGSRGSGKTVREHAGHTPTFATPSFSDTVRAAAVRNVKARPQLNSNFGEALVLTALANTFSTSENTPNTSENSLTTASERLGLPPCRDPESPPALTRRCRGRPLRSRRSSRPPRSCRSPAQRLHASRRVF